MAKVYLSEVTKLYRHAGGQSGIRMLSIDLDSQKFTTILGPNGSGKTTVLNLIAGLHKPDTGQVIYELSGSSAPTISYVWQDYRSSLLPWLDAINNVAFPLKLKGVSKSARRRIAAELIFAYAPDVNGDKRCSSLSGGQQQKVAIVRGIAAKPDILLLDEPFSALDYQARWSMLFALEMFCLNKPLIGVLVSHDIDEALLLGDQILLLPNNQAQRPLVLENTLPHPRGLEMLTAPEHLRNRAQAIDFLYAFPSLVSYQTKSEVAHVL